MEEWKEIGFCTTTTYYCYYYILLLIPLPTCYLLLATYYYNYLYSAYTRYANFRAGDHRVDIYNLLFSMVFIFIIIVNLLA